MEKSVKLQRYDRKDYSELVEFPVEIVGRDGVVRRYSFEDSIRLYQRRVAFAHIRYRDVDLARAEVNHCRSRIEQLRRSYFHRFGWGTPEGHRSPDQNFGELAGELAAFICRVLGVDHRPGIEFAPVDDDHAGTSTWYLRVENVQTGMLLYFHRFDGPQPDAVRDRFFARLKALETHGVPSGDAERLLAFHHTADCGFALTGRGGDFQAPRVGESAIPTAADSDAPNAASAPPLTDSDLPIAASSASALALGITASASVNAASQRAFLIAASAAPKGQFGDEDGLSDERAVPSRWDAVLNAVRRGDYDSALTRCRELVREQPWHRGAYVCGAMVATYLGDVERGEELATLGLRYFPEEPALLYYVGACQVRLGRREAGEAALRQAIVLAPEITAPRSLLATELIRTGRLTQARRVLRVLSPVPTDERRLAGDVVGLRRSLLGLVWCRVAVAGSLIGGVVGATLVGNGLPLLVSLLPILGCAGAAASLQRQFDRFVNRRRAEEIAHGLRFLQRRPRIGAGIS
jgi:tetratricopeptide (TPR) repeat protein